jgi:hypothetical protein
MSRTMVASAQEPLRTCPFGLLRLQLLGARVRLAEDPDTEEGDENE